MNKITLKRDESLYLREMSLFLISENLDPALKGLTFTEARLTNDYSYLTLYYTVLAKDKLAFYEELLAKYNKQIRAHLASKVNSFKMPQVIFKYDESLDYGNKIESILKNL